MNTKDRILEVALDLFSKRGYSDVYVDEIASEVGIKAPSLYKHYKNKQEIFDSCVNMFYEKMTKIRNDLLLPGTINSDLSYSSVDTNMIVKFSISLFMFYLKDEVASKFRRMLMIERYRNSELNTMYENLFINGALSYEEKIFSNLIKEGVMKEEDPHVLAIRFYSPIFYLLQKYDMHLEKEDEAKKEFTLLIEEFCKNYKGSK